MQSPHGSAFRPLYNGQKWHGDIRTRTRFTSGHSDNDGRWQRR